MPPMIAAHMPARRNRCSLFVLQKIDSGPNPKRPAVEMKLDLCPAFPAIQLHDFAFRSGKRISGQTNFAAYLKRLKDPDLPVVLMDHFGKPAIRAVQYICFFCCPEKTENPVYRFDFPKCENRRLCVNEHISRQIVLRLFMTRSLDPFALNNRGRIRRQAESPLDLRCDLPASVRIAKQAV